MRHHALLHIAAVICATAVLVPASFASEVPSTDGPEILALVNGEPITLDAYLRALGELHAESMDIEQSVSRKDPTQLLDRLIRVELILQEASAIGLDEQPEFLGAVEAFRKELLQAELFDYAVRDLPPPTPAEIERRYVDIQTELEVSGLQFKSIEDAEAFRAAVGEGQEFETLAKTYLADGRAADFRDRAWLVRNDLAPAVVKELAKLENGQISPPVSIGPVFTVVKLYGSRLNEDADARATAEAEVANANRMRTLRKYIDNLKEQYTQTDKELLESLDFESDAAEFDVFLKDDRPLVRIEDEDPIRVRDLAAKLQGGLFHGVEQAAKSQRLNKDKARLLDELTIARVIQLEAERLDLDETEEFQVQLSEFEDSILFGQFVTRVLDPSVEVGEEEVESYYTEHLADYTEPGMVRLDTLVFSDTQTAQRALEHLKTGADMAWMRANAAGQVDRESVPEDMRFDKRLLAETSLAEGVRDAITGAVSGDYRLYAASADRLYVIQVIERMPATARSLDRVRNEVRQQVYTINRQEDLEKWMDRLREASEVELLVDEDQLRRLVMGEVGNPTK